MRNFIKVRTLSIIAAVCVIVAATHWPSLSAKALSFDDQQYLIDNSLVQNPSLASAKRFLTEVLEPSTVRGYYQPLAMISLMLDYAAGGRENNLRPFHITSLALHTANTALIIVLLYLLFDNIWIAAAVGLLFGVHPMTVEPIPWIGERKTLLAAFFAFWSLILYVRYARTKNLKFEISNLNFYAGCFLMYLLALMSKPTSTPLPVVMLLMDYWPLKRLNIKTFIEKIPLLALGIISAVITYISQHRTAATVSPVEYGTRHILLVVCHNIIFYLYKIILPIDLSSHYAFPKPLDLSNTMVLAGVVGTCILIPLLFLSLRWTRAAFTGWLIFFAAIFPVMGVVGFTNVIASDKYAYLPAVGLLMTLTAFLIWLCRNSRARIIAIAVVLLLTGAEAFATQRYLAYWQDTITLAKYILSLSPDAAGVYTDLGFAYSRLGRYDDEIEAYQRAIKIDPSVGVYYNLGCAYRQLGRWDEAIEAYKRAIRIRPSVEAYSNLATIYARQGRWLETIRAFEEGIKLKPKDADIRYNLGVAYSKQSRWAEAAESFEVAVKLKPNDAGAYFNLGVACGHLERFANEIDAYEQAIKIQPNHTGSHFNLALAYLRQNDKVSAFEQYKILNQLNPQLAQKLLDYIK